MDALASLPNIHLQVHQISAHSCQLVFPKKNPSPKPCETLLLRLKKLKQQNS